VTHIALCILIKVYYCGSGGAPPVAPLGGAPQSVAFYTDKKK